MLVGSALLALAASGGTPMASGGPGDVAADTSGLQALVSRLRT